MNKLRPLLCGALIATASTLTAQADVLVGWDVHGLVGGNNIFGPSPLASTTLANGLSTDGLVRGTGVVTTGSAGANRAWGGVGWTSTSAANAITANQYATFSLTVDQTHTLSLSSIDQLNYRRSGTGPTTGLLQYEIGDGGFTDLTTLNYSVTTSSGANLAPIDLSGISALQDIAGGTTVTFRIVNYGGTGATGTWYIFDVANSTANDLELLGTVTQISVPEPGSLALLSLGCLSLVVLRRRQ